MNAQHEMFVRLAGSREAGDMLWMLWRSVSTWDDLIDGDVPVKPEEVTQAFWNLLIAIPANPFYARNADALRPVLLTAVQNWLAGNELAAEGHRDLDWFLRMGFVDVVGLCAFINGGPGAGVKAVKESRLFLKREEPLEQYCAAGVPVAPAGQDEKEQ